MWVDGEQPPAPGASTTQTGNSTSCVIDKPSGVVSGTVLYFAIQMNSTSPTTPALTGWSSIGIDSYASGFGDLTVLRRVADASEGATFTFTWTNSARFAAIMIALSGVDNTTPEDGVTPSTNFGSSVTPTATGITTATANAMLIMVSGHSHSGGTGEYATWSSPLAEVVEVGDGNGTTLAMATGTQVTAGASGNKTVTTDDRAWTAALISVRGVATASVKTLSLLGVGT